MTEQYLQVLENDNGTTTVTTPNGSSTMPSALWSLFASCTSPVPLVEFCAKAKREGFSNGYVRARVQSLAQPGQYRGSACIGAISTIPAGKRLMIQVATHGAADKRPTLTRNGANTAQAQAEGAVPEKDEK